MTPADAFVTTYIGEISKEIIVLRLHNVSTRHDLKSLIRHTQHGLRHGHIGKDPREKQPTLSISIREQIWRNLGHLKPQQIAGNGIQQMRSHVPPSERE